MRRLWHADLLPLDFSAAKWCVVACICILTWVLVLALAALCVAHVPIGRYRRVPGSLFLAGVVLFFISKEFGWATILSLLDRFAPSVNLLLPTGWAASLFQLLLPNPSWMVLALILPIAAVLYTPPGSLYRLEEFFISF